MKTVKEVAQAVRETTRKIGNQVFNLAQQDIVHTPEGHEIPDPTPMAPPLGYVKSEPLHLQIQRMVRSEALRLAAEQANADTFEEADDFDVDDELDPRSGWENDFDPSYAEIEREVQSHWKTKERAEKMKGDPAVGRPEPPPAAPKPRRKAGETADPLPDQDE